MVVIGTFVQRLERVSAAGVGTVSAILPLEVIAQGVAHFAGAIELLEIGKVYVRHDVLHVQHFDLQFCKYPHVFDQELLAGD
ncbi:hypothetical protein D9M71_157390 [compost metagenome]